MHQCQLFSWRRCSLNHHQCYHFPNFYKPKWCYMSFYVPTVQGYREVV